MNYNEAIDYLYASAPLFQNKGATAYKEGLSTTYALDTHFGHPHQNYRTIHVAGTNGKGSCSHFLASVLQESGYKVGLYTSPHLLDFRERIKVNGKEISKEYVTEFINSERHFFEPLHPSFFEIATALAFKYFSDQKIDVAVVEVGLGGRLDCTNIITPVFNIITNISFDHTSLLGKTLGAIAKEKAGIMKPGVPTVIGEYTVSTRKVFEQTSESVGCPIIFASDSNEIKTARHTFDGTLFFTHNYGRIFCDLGGIYQKKNINTILHALPYLMQNFPKVNHANIVRGLAKVKTLTGLMGRWQQIRKDPYVYCDTGHNVGGIRYVAKQLGMQDFKSLRIVIGMVNDKDINGVLALLPKNAIYYFTQASVARALNCKEVRKLASRHGLRGNAYTSVEEAYRQALADSVKEDFIFVGGSTFIVADLLKISK